MSKLKISVDEDLFFFHSPKGIWTFIFFWKKWNYHVEIPINRLSKAEVKKYLFVHELVLVKQEKIISVYLGRTNKNQRLFLAEALPKIINEHISYSQIKKIKKECYGSVKNYSLF